MPIQLTPGYSFSVNEIPTRAKLGLSMTGMSISGIGATNISTTVITVTVSDTTQVSLSEGALWVDAQNNLWGRTRRGNVIVKRYGGGWESNRYVSLGDGNGAGPAPVRPGDAMKFSSLDATDTNESSIAFALYSGQDSDPGTFCAVPASTSVSGAFDRLIFKGRARIYAADFLPTTNRAVKLYRRPAFSNFFVAEDFYVGGSEVGVAGESDETDPDGDADYCYAYFFGPHIRRGF